MPYQDDYWSDFGDENSVDFKIRQKKAADELNKLDKQYEKYTVTYNKTGSDGKFHKKMTIENFGSYGPGTKIRNAVTGATYDILVGSANEELLFKVIESTGRYGRRYPLMLYYDSPEQFENHHFLTISTDTKQKWYERNLQTRKRLKLI